ncbi:MAG: Asp-tRNA(Asn)/Glu-tRNA(Gln) amidotransferase GatCAB subunit B, partial [Nitrospinota bacterium]
RALEYEIERQIKLLTGGREVIQETRLWDPSQGVTTSMRQKEEAHDYRYFPEPDLVPLEVDEEWVERIRATLPESPQAKLERFMESYGLPEYDARILTSTRALADYFEECTGLYPQPKTVSNWVMGELLRVLKERKLELEECRVTARHLASLLKMVESGEITGTIAKAVFEEMAATGEMPEEVVEKKGLRPITDAAELSAIVEKVLAENPDPVKKYRAGKEKLLGFLVGQVMKATGGKANPGELQRMLREKLSSKER